MRVALAGLLAAGCLAAAGCGGGDEQSWAGTWTTSYGRMVLHQDGTKVTGSYAFCSGTLDGEASDDRLSGTWRQERGCDGTDVPTGTFDFELDGQETSFEGIWTYAPGGSAESGRFPWEGRRVSTP